MKETWSTLILAAGKGTRMKSDLAKVLHPIDGKPLLTHVLDTAARLQMEKTIVVVGHQADAVKDAHAGYDLAYATGSEPVAFSQAATDSTCVSIWPLSSVAPRA